MGVAQVQMVAVVNLTAWVGAAYVWRSPAWQAKHLPRSAARLAPAVRAVLDNAIGPLHEVAARQSFWTLEPSYLQNLCRLLRIDLPPGPSLLGVLLLLI